MITNCNSKQHIAADKIDTNQKWEALEKRDSPCWNNQYISLINT